MPRRHLDWLRQAKRNLASAELNRGAGLYEEACFEGHQAAEKALKALLSYMHMERRGHSLVALAREAGLAVGEDLMRCLQYLDKHYIPARYPDVYDEGAPMDYYNEEDAERCIQCAERVLSWVEGRVGPL
ncbi:MAG: HEPN domain-containing protein [Thermoproteus sp. AZ2]|uniref:HEPN domain-containing protein n=1 Tax=Thermoproteus sp. AZ2 TaxID=1609232 RepID=A0ACC6V1T3_9CREN|nr:MAG: DNA-binding protein [Thermoproteus sp. AZ2]